MLVPVLDTPTIPVDDFPAATTTTTTTPTTTSSTSRNGVAAGARSGANSSSHNRKNRRRRNSSGGSKAMNSPVTTVSNSAPSSSGMNLEGFNRQHQNQPQSWSPNSRRLPDEGDKSVPATRPGRKGLASPAQHVEKVHSSSGDARLGVSSTTSPPSPAGPRTGSEPTSPSTGFASLSLENASPHVRTPEDRLRERRQRPIEGETTGLRPPLQPYVAGEIVNSPAVAAAIDTMPHAAPGGAGTLTPARTSSTTSTIQTTPSIQQQQQQQQHQYKLEDDDDDDEEEIIPLAEDKPRSFTKTPLVSTKSTSSMDTASTVHRPIRSYSGNTSNTNPTVVPSSSYTKTDESLPQGAANTTANADATSSVPTEIDTKGASSTTSKVISEAVNELQFLASSSKLPVIREIPQVRWKHIEMGEILGLGGFSQVNRAHVTKSPTLIDGYFALKCLDDRFLQQKDSKHVVQAALDIAVEGEILSRLQHENIIKLHGMATTDLIANQFSNKSMRDYFLLLDILEETLYDRLQQWRRKRFVKNLVGRPLSKKRMLDRVEMAAIGVARGMKYLHENQVVLRDLKPENVGFDGEGVPKLFDFGFARESHNVRADEIAGSECYMAPEMTLGLGSDITSDVYSFGVVLWELCSLQKPHEQFKLKKGFRKGNRMNYNFRPSVTSIPSPALRKLIKECWSFRSTDRPNFESILKVLEVIPMEVYDRPSSQSVITDDSSHAEDLAASAREFGMDTSDHAAGGSMHNSCKSDGFNFGMAYVPGESVGTNSDHFVGTSKSGLAGLERSKLISRSVADGEPRDKDLSSLIYNKGTSSEDAVAPAEARVQRSVSASSDNNEVRNSWRKMSGGVFRSWSLSSAKSDDGSSPVKEKKPRLRRASGLFRSRSGASSSSEQEVGTGQQKQTNLPTSKTKKEEDYIDKLLRQDQNSEAASIAQPSEVSSQVSGNWPPHEIQQVKMPTSPRKGKAKREEDYKGKLLNKDRISEPVTVKQPSEPVTVTQSSEAKLPRSSWSSNDHQQRTSKPSPVNRRASYEQPAVAPPASPKATKRRVSAYEPRQSPRQSPRLSPKTGRSKQRLSLTRSSQPRMDQLTPPLSPPPRTRLSLSRNSQPKVEKKSTKSKRQKMKEAERQLEEATDAVVMLQAEKNALVSRLESIDSTLADVAEKKQQKRQKDLVQILTKEKEDLERRLQKVESNISQQAMQLVEAQNLMEDLET